MTVTFRRVLLGATQDTFELLREEFTDAEQAGRYVESLETVNSLRAVVFFIGHLCLHRLLAFPAVELVMFNLVGDRDRQAKETLIRCGCELTQVVGQVMETQQYRYDEVSASLEKLGGLAPPHDTGGNLQ